MNTETPKHTPTPWRIAPSGGLSGNGEIVVCNDIPTLIECEEKPMTNGFGRAAAKTAHIVLCVHSHERLVAAWREALAALTYDGSTPISAHEQKQKATLPIILAALAAAQVHDTDCSIHRAGGGDCVALIPGAYPTAQPKPDHAPE